MLVILRVHAQGSTIFVIVFELIYKTDLEYKNKLLSPNKVM